MTPQAHQSQLKINYCMFLSATWMNRVQNESIFTACMSMIEEWRCEVTFESSQNHGWQVPDSSITYSENGKDFLIILPSKQNDNRHYSHLARVQTKSNAAPKFLTQGLFVVTEILTWDEPSQKIYLMATKAGDPGSRHLYSVEDTGTSLKCETCSLLVCMVIKKGNTR